MHIFLNLLFSLASIQDPCPQITPDKQLENSDVVAVVVIDEEETDFFYGMFVVFKVRKVYKGWVDHSLFVSFKEHDFKKDTEYLIFADHIGEDKWDHKYSFDECSKAVELKKASPELVKLLENRWDSECYSKELEEELKGMANTRELYPICGCDGKSYQNFGHLMGSGITQYFPGKDCEEIFENK